MRRAGTTTTEARPGRDWWVSTDLLGLASGYHPRDLPGRLPVNRYTVAAAGLALFGLAWLAGVIHPGLAHLIVVGAVLLGILTLRLPAHSAAPGAERPDGQRAGSRLPLFRCGRDSARVEPGQRAGTPRMISRASSGACAGAAQRQAGVHPEQ